LLAQICSDDFGTRIDGLTGMAAFGATGEVEQTLWARRVVNAFEGRALRCRDAEAFIETPEGVVSAVTLAPATDLDPTTLSSPSVNLKLRAIAASATGLLALLTEPEVQARLDAARAIDRRREALNADVVKIALDRESAPEVSDLLARLYASLLLDDPDPARRIAAIEAIGAVATQRNLSLLTEALAREPDPTVRAAGAEVVIAMERTRAAGAALSTLYSGLSYASILFLAALGLAIIFGLMGVINLAQGELIMIGAYAAWMVQEGIRAVAPGLVDYALILAIPFSFAAAAGVGVAMEALVIRRLYTRPLMTLLATWAISLLLINTVRVVFGTQNLEFHQPFYVSGGIPVLGDFIMTLNRLFAIVIAVVACLGVLALLRGTVFGLNIRAVTQNREMAGAAGIDTRRTDRLTFGLGSGLAGLAGLALSPLYNVNPNMGANFIVDSFMVVVLGGVGSLVGAVLAALGIGQINVVIEPLYGAVAAKVLVLLLIIAFIQWRPEGLFAPKGRR
jgi:urea transport system permease protein